jgi:hypothetical protein
MATWQNNPAMMANMPQEAPPYVPSSIMQMAAQMPPMGMPMAQMPPMGMPNMGMPMAMSQQSLYEQFQAVFKEIRRCRPFMSQLFAAVDEAFRELDSLMGWAKDKSMQDFLGHFERTLMLKKLPAKPQPFQRFERIFTQPNHNTFTNKTIFDEMETVNLYLFLII